MRKSTLYYLLVMLTFTACSTNKKIVDNFVNGDFHKNNPSENIIMDQKIPNRHAFKILKGMSMTDGLGNVSSTGSKLLPVTMMNYFDDYTRNDTVSKEKWITSDFQKTKAIIMSSDLKEIHDYTNTHQKNGIGYYYDVYVLSDFITTRDKKYGFFYIGKSSAPGLGWSVYSKVILFERKNRKWEIIEQINDYVLN